MDTGHIARIPFYLSNQGYKIETLIISIFDVIF